MRKHLGLVITAALALCALMVATGISSAATSTHATSKTFKLAKNKGTVSIIEAGDPEFGDGNLLKFTANLQKKGYTVKTTVFEDQANALRAVVAGRASFLFGGMTEAIVADAHSPAHVQVVGVSNQRSNYLILSQPKFNLSNLSGATIGISAPGDATQILVEAALKNKGINPKSLKYVTIGGSSARVTALLAGQIDLAPVLSPTAAPAVATGKVKILLNTGPAVGPYLDQTLLTTQKYISAHRTLVQDSVNALIDAARWADINETGYIQVINKAGLDSGLTPNEEKIAWLANKQSGINAVNGGLCPRYVTHTLQYSYASGALKKSDVPKQSVWVDNEFVHTYLNAHHQKVNVC